eukprot:1478081-Pleurochrysis_carterae.AAC.1
MLAGTPYCLPASLAASKLRSYMIPGVHSLTPNTDARRWAVGARNAQPLLKPAFALSLSRGAPWQARSSGVSAPTRACAPL